MTLQPIKEMSVANNSICASLTALAWNFKLVSHEKTRCLCVPIEEAVNFDIKFTNGPKSCLSFLQYLVAQNRNQNCWKVMKWKLLVHHKIRILYAKRYPSLALDISKCEDWPEPSLSCTENLMVFRSSTLPVNLMVMLQFLLFEGYIGYNVPSLD